MRSLLLALAVLLAACGSTPAAVAPAAVAPVAKPRASAPTAPAGPEASTGAGARPHGCADTPLPAHLPASVDARERAAACAHTPDRWGKGYRALWPPRGFRTAPPPEDAEPSDLVKKLVSLADGVEVTVEIFDHPAAAAADQRLFRYAVRAFDANGEDLDEYPVDDEDLLSWFDRVAELRDERGRRIVEWAYVEKGCERGERYERFIEDGDHLWHIRMEVSPSAPEEDLLQWMALFFDAPLAGPAPVDRRGLAGKATPR